LPSPEDLGSATELQLSDRGGHVGFIARGNRAWLEQQIARFLLSSD
jgi:predicted alpha/beta-fold hydrolase